MALSAMHAGKSPVAQPLRQGLPEQSRQDLPEQGKLF